MVMGQSKVSHFTLLARAHLSSLILMPFHHNHCAQAQSGIYSMPAYNLSLRQNLSASFTVMLIAFLSAFVFVGFFTLCVRHCTSSQDAAAGVRRRRINPEIANNCPILVYSTVKDLKIGRGALECAVCLGEFQDSDKLRLLPKCHHVFHPDCIDTWLASHLTCPICRTRVLSDCGESAVAVPIPTNTSAPSDSASGNPTTTVSTTSSSETELQLVVPNANEDVENDNTESQAVPETDNLEESAVCQKQSPPPEARTLDKLKRSHSTGHSLVEEKIERGILRLPEHVRYRIVENHSDVVLGRVRCSKEGFCRNESNVERWRLSMTPPFAWRVWGSVGMPEGCNITAASSDFIP